MKPKLNLHIAIEILTKLGYEAVQSNSKDEEPTTLRIKKDNFPPLLLNTDVEEWNITGYISKASGEPITFQGRGQEALEQKLIWIDKWE